MTTLRTTMCDDCYFSDKYAALRAAEPVAWGQALMVACDLRSPYQFCHTSENTQLCAGMAAWQQHNLGRMSDAAIAAKECA